MDTPETDQFAEEEASGLQSVWSLYVLTRNLERERNKAREDATNYYARIGELLEERDKLNDIIKRAQATFYEDGEDGNICVRMLEILKESKC